MVRRLFVFLTGLALLAGCSSDPAGRDQLGPPPDAKPVAKITAVPAVNAKDVEVTEPVKVSIADGKLDTVTLTNPDGKSVKGEFAPDRSLWHTTEVLGFGKSYTYAAKGTGTDGKPVQLAGRFTTLSPASTIRATVNPVDDAVVGVGMPISVKFASPPADRAAAEKALEVETAVEVEGGWAWIKPTQVDWRPKEYWPANTKVKLSANLNGV